MAEFTTDDVLLSAVQKFVLRARHGREEYVDAELEAFETTVGDCTAAFQQLHGIYAGKSNAGGEVGEVPSQQENRSEDLSNFLKAIRDAPMGPRHFVQSISFPVVFTAVGDLSPELLLPLLQVVALAPLPALTQEVCAVVIPRATAWVALEDAAVAESAAGVLERACVMEPEVALPALMQAAQAADASGDSTVRLRYASVLGALLASTFALEQAAASRSDVAQFTSVSDLMFSWCVREGAVSLLLSMSVESTDLLLQLLGVELLSNFAGGALALRYFFEQRYFAWLATQASGPRRQDPSVDPFVAAACLAEVAKLFEKARQAGTAQVLVSLLNADQENMEEILRCCVYTMDSESHSDETARVAALATCTAVSSLSPHWLRRLSTHKGLLEDWLGLINGGPDTQAALLVSMSSVLRAHLHPSPSAGIAEVVVNVEVDAGTDALLSRDLARLVEGLGARRPGNLSTVAYLVKVGSQPVTHLAVAALGLLEALALQPSGWGVNTLFACSKLYPFLLDRSTTICKATMEAKHNVLQAISRSSRYSLLATEVVTALDRELERGPFAPPHRAELADLQTI